MTKKIEVTEIFGPTLQGEGPMAGHPAMFLRLRRCNLQCVWCDTRKPGTRIISSTISLKY